LLFIITLSLAAGAPLGFQLPAVVQAPPFVGSHVLVVWANELFAKNKFAITRAIAIINDLRKNFFIIDLFCLLHRAAKGSIVDSFVKD